MATVRTLIGNIKGPKGDTGATGATGPQGPGATINVGTVSTTAYGNPVQITNSGTETDAVLDFVIPQGKPGEQTTKMSSLTLDTITTQTAEYPIPAVGDVGSTAWGKIVKFFNDIKTAVTGKVDTTSIVNNLTSTSTDKPLSAAQGKALNDAIATKIGQDSNASKKIETMSYDPLNGGVGMYPTAKGAWAYSPLIRGATVNFLGGSLSIVVHSNIMVMGISYGTAVTPAVNVWTTFAQLPAAIGVFNPITLALVDGKSISIRASGSNLQYLYSGTGSLFLQGGGATTVPFHE